ncbi:MAG: stalk domain-containing protein [Firmicutes bacterium]|nr:stalk domain-containing protein [Bacillota bacterium]
MKFRKRAVSAAIAAALALCAPLAAGAASPSAVIEVNGVKAETDAPPVIKNGVTYVPVRSLGEALGFAVSYDDASRMVTLKHSAGVSLGMKIDGSETTLNGKKMGGVAVLNINGRVMVPARFVSESLFSKVDWVPANGGCEPRDKFNHVEIYNQLFPVKTASGIGVSALLYNDAKTVDAGKDGTYTYSVSARLPQLSGLKDAKTQKALNDGFKALLKNAQANVAAAYKGDGSGVRWNAGEDLTFHVTENTAKTLSIVVEEYSDTFGGAHGTPYRTGYTIDAASGKLMKLTDVVKGADYKSVLLKKINDLRVKNPGGMYDGLFDPKSPITEAPPADSFYIEDGNLVVFYNPYDIGPYAMGFVTFSMPLAGF